MQGKEAVNVQKYFEEMAEVAERGAEDPFAEKRTATIADREAGKYTAQRQKVTLSPGVRYDPFAEGSQTPDVHSVRRTHHAVMRETQVLKDKVGSRSVEVSRRIPVISPNLKVVRQNLFLKSRIFEREKRFCEMTEV